MSVSCSLACFADGGDLAEHLSTHVRNTVSHCCVEGACPMLWCSPPRQKQIVNVGRAMRTTCVAMSTFTGHPLCTAPPPEAGRLSLLQGGGLAEGAARCIFQQLVSALEWVHNCGKPLFCRRPAASFLLVPTEMAPVAQPHLLQRCRVPQPPRLRTKAWTRSAVQASRTAT